MESITDDFSDLDLSPSDNEDSENNLTQHFNKAANHVQTIAANLNSTTLLTLYGFYKQGMEGKCNVSKPGFFDVKGKSKWEAWNKLGEMPKDEARKLYVEEVQRIDPLFKVSGRNKNKGDKSISGWVTVSTLQKTSEDSDSCDDDSDDSGPSLKDYIKHSDFENVERTLLEMISDDDEDRASIVKLFRVLDEDGLGLLHWAADRGCPKVLESLLSICGVEVNFQDSDGQTALHYAVSVGHEECVERLLKHGADPFVKDTDGCDCFDVVGDNASIKSLLDKHSSVK